MALTFLFASTALQAVAMVVAVRVAVRKRLPGWVFIAVALVLMLARRLVSLYAALALDRSPDVVAELVALVISALMVTGLVILLRPDAAEDARTDDLDDAALSAINRVKYQALILAVIAVAGAAALIVITYRENRDEITERLSRGSLDLAHMLETGAGLAQARGADGLQEVAELWRQAESAYPDNYLCVIGADGRLQLNTLRPAMVGRFVGGTAIPSSDPDDPRTVGELVSARRDWAGRNRNTSGEEQIAAYAYAQALDALVAVHVPAANVDARIRAAALPWALGFAGIFAVVLPVSLGLLFRASSASQAAALRAVSKRRHTEDRYRQIIETTREGIWMIDAENRTSFVNEHMAVMLGWRVEEMVGQTIDAFLDEEGRVLARQRVALRRQGLPGVHEVKFVHKSGREVLASLSTNPLRNADGSYAGTMAIVSDITERRQLEIQVRHAQKMEAVGQLAGGVAHDFNNLLMVIQGSVALLQRGVADPAERAEYEQQIMEAAQRAATLTRQLLTFSRKQVMQTTAVDLNAVVGRVTRMLQRIVGEDIRLEAALAPALPAIAGDPGMVEQVILNLAVNARDAMPRGGVLRITTLVEEVDATAAGAHPDRSPGRHVGFDVCDSGTGIAPENLSRIFEPFFTTKDVGKGTGLGLATVYGIMKQHRGWVTVSSELGEGTTFQVRFPVGAGPAVTATVPPPKTPLPGGTETILVVEDDPAVRPLIEQILRRCGYTVLTASSGVAALDVWREHHARIDLVMTDVVMPDGVSGRELVTQLRAQRPDLRVILTSGYDREVADGESTATPGLAFLQKPCLPETLARLVRAQLDRR